MNETGQFETIKEIVDMLEFSLLRGTDVFHGNGLGLAAGGVEINKYTFRYRLCELMLYRIISEK